MNNEGSLNALIGADISGYQKAMSEVANLTKQAFDSAQNASQMGAKNMMRTMQHMMKGIIQSTNADVQRIVSQLGTVFNKADAVVRQGMSRIADKIPEPIAQAMQRADYHVRRGWGNVQASTQQAMATVSSAVDTGFSKSFEMASNGFYRLAHSVQDISPSLANTFNNLSRQMAYASENGTQAFMSGMRSLVSSVGSVLNSVADQFNPLVRVAGNTANQMVESFSRGFNNMNRKASGVLNSISEHFAKGSKGSNSFKNSVMQLASAFSLAGLASKGIQAITSSFDDAIGRFDALNQFPRIMEMWGYSAEDAQRSTDKMQDGIDGLPTKLDDITSNVQRLTTITGDLDGSTDSAIALNNAFLASGASTADASRGFEQYSQMLATGKVDMMSWRTLQETMPGALMQTAEAFGYTGQSATTDFYDALQSGEITFDQFQDKLIELNEGVDGFAEQAKEATVGIKTSLQNLHTAVSRNVEGIIRKFDEVLESRGLPQIAVMIDKGKYAINDLGEAVQKVVPNIVDGFMSLSSFDIVAMLALPKAISLVASFGTKLGGLAPLAHDSASGMMTAFGSISEKLGGLAQSIGGFGGLMTQTASVGVNALGGMVSAITSLAGVALSAIGPTAILGLVVTGLGIVNKSFGEEINNMLTMITEKAPQVIGNLVSGIQESLPELLMLGTQLIADLANVIVENLPLVVDAGMEILNSLLTGISEMFPSLINSALQIITIITTSILEALPQLVLMGFQIILSFVEGINENIDTIIQSAQTILTGFVNSILENLPQIIETGINIILSLIQGLNEMLPELLIIGFQSLITLVQGIMENVPLLLDGAVMIVQSLVGFIVENLPMLLEMGMQLIFTIIDGIFQNLPQLVVAGTQIIFTLITGLIQMLPEILSMGITLVTELISGIAQNLPMIIATGIQLVFEFIGGLFSMLPDIWNMGWDMIVELGRGLLEAIPNILTAAWDGIKDGFGNMWNWITGKNNEGIAETESQFNTLNTNATTSTAHMAENVSINASNATSHLSNASSQARMRGSSDYSNLATNVSGSMSTMSGNVSTQMGSQFSSVSTNTNQLSSLGYSNYDSMAGNVASSLGGMTGNVDSETGAQLSSVTSNLSGASSTGSQEYTDLSNITSDTLSGMTASVESETQAQQNAIEQGTSASNKQAEQSYKQMADTANKSLNQMTQSTTQSFNKIKNQISQSLRSTLTAVRSALNAMRSAFIQSMRQMTAITRQQMAATVAVVRSAMQQMLAVMRSANAGARSAGMNVGAGFRVGLASTRGSIVGTARSIASAVTSTISSALSIRSPARKLIELGSFAGEGLDIGLAGWIDEIKKTALQMSDAIMLDDYQLQSSIATSANIESSGVSSRLDNLSDEVRNTERTEPVYEIHNTFDGDEIYTTVKRKDARKENTSKYFRGGD